MSGAAIINQENISGLIQRTLNCVDPRLVDHGLRVAFVVSRMLKIQGRYDEKEQQEICFLAMLHDIGAYKTEEINEMIRFESSNVESHSIYGYLFLKHLSPLSHIASAVLYHHTDVEALEPQVPCRDIAQIIYLADRVDMFVTHTTMNRSVLRSYLEKSRGRRFDDDIVDVFWVAQEQYGLLEALKGTIRFEDIADAVDMAEETIDCYLKMVIYAIDFRSQHTVTHTITTTEISRSVARLMGMSEQQQKQVYYGALLHDLGKIGIPVEILEFPGKLSAQAMTIMRTHVDITERILGGAVEEGAANIALRHHEKLDGSGYPKGLKADALTMCQRIVAVADIVSALLGTRSYKDAYPKERTLDIIGEQADQGKLDSRVVSLLTEHFDEIVQEVREHCAPILEIYHGIHREFEQMALERAASCPLKLQ